MSSRSLSGIKACRGISLSLFGFQSKQKPSHGDSSALSQAYSVGMTIWLLNETRHPLPIRV